MGLSAEDRANYVLVVRANETERLILKRTSQETSRTQWGCSVHPCEPPFWFSDGRCFRREQLEPETRLMERTIREIWNKPRDPLGKKRQSFVIQWWRSRMLLRELAVLAHLSKHDCRRLVSVSKSKRREEAISQTGWV